ncbi:tyrosine-protein phosphatase 10D-like isoform X2 [Limulus polyphemus]|uniref:Tyrosine-protein phosphatase 10D-like isoform X2 n=1 Tax=Limulus polyphemus TaxID=6850 RepID=A0ABM1C061_LIMPO|nr:tyrosine-protein phosphatase 10D-like isoform X2 [Limulus polyphemus]
MSVRANKVYFTSCAVVMVMIVFLLSLSKLASELTQEEDFQRGDEVHLEIDHRTLNLKTYRDEKRISRGKRIRRDVSNVTNISLDKDKMNIQNNVFDISLITPVDDLINLETDNVTDSVSSNNTVTIKALDVSVPHSDNNVNSSVSHLSTSSSFSSITYDSTTIPTSTEIPVCPGVNINIHSIRDTQVKLELLNLSQIITYNLNYSVLMCYQKNDEPQSRTLINTTECIDDVLKDFVCSNFTELDNLSPFTNYTIYVQVLCSNQFCGPSDFVNVQTDVGGPSAPQNFTSEFLNGTFVALRWKEPKIKNGPLDGYKIEWVLKATQHPNCCIESSVEENEEVILGNTFDYEISGLNPWTIYEITVKAFNKNKNNVTREGEENTLNVRTGSYYPSKPRNFTAKALNSSVIRLQWKDPKCPYGTIVRYIISWSSDSYDVECRFIEDINIRKYDVHDLEPWSVYKLTIYVVNDGQFESENVSTSERTHPAAASKPENLEARNLTSKSLLLTWNVPSQPNGDISEFYIVYSEKDNSSVFTKFTPFNNTSFDIFDLKPFTNYSFCVKALTKFNKENIFGEEECIDTQTEEDSPEEPQNLKTSKVTSNSIKLTWSVPSKPNGIITNYSVCTNFYKNCSHDHWNFVTTSTCYTLKKLHAYTAYNLSVAAWTSAGLGKWASVLTEMTQIGVPYQPCNVKVTNVTSRHVSLQWTRPKVFTGPTNYTVQIKVSKPISNKLCPDENYTILEDCSTCDASQWNTTLMEISNLKPFHCYRFVVIAVTLAGRNSSIPSSHVLTEMDIPGPPTRGELHCNISPTIVRIRWSLPNETNGLIENYFLEFTGQKPGKPIHNGNITIYGFQSEGTETNISCNITCGGFVDNLKPEFTYSFSVRAKTTDVTDYGEEYVFPNSTFCKLPAGVPHPPSMNLSIPEKVNITDKQKQAAVFIYKSTFDDEMGDITHYALIIAEDLEIGEPLSDLTDNRSSLPTWKQRHLSKEGMYQATPVPWNPFNESSEYSKDGGLMCSTFVQDGVLGKTCLLGTETDCFQKEETIYCNGPLQPGTNYGIKLRGYTRKGYSETYPLFIQTASPESEAKKSNAATIGLTLMVLIIFIGTGLCLLYRKGYFPSPPWKEKQQSAANSIALSFDVKTRSVKIADFNKHYEEMISDSALKFSKEFDELNHKSKKCPQTAAELQENRSKNRWINILPFDHSRVKLLPIDDEPSSDYINANYIPGFYSPREYIATQGPLPGTIDDFWRMVWEQNVTIIIMVTQCVERGKTKCEVYWPTDTETQLYGDLEVQMTSESILAEYVIRIFHVQLGNRHRIVKQMHFTRWPDFGCPENTEVMINFVRAVRDHIPRINHGPLVVHCSAGVGRTGTFLALDRLMQHIRVHDYVDVFWTVLEMREYRSNLVQTEDQYIYIHECINDLIAYQLKEKRTFGNDKDSEELYSNVIYGCESRQ